MFAYAIHEIRSAELRRQAADARLVREAVRSRRAARRAEAPGGAAEPAESHTAGRGRSRFPRTA
ncbi:hypothetical protein ABZ646_43695 [Streptomyces sp. NPDC007162]|uniref:hypothetical protein n=1 Tax=Streptomyces sp. NPDC007162 TaxID=3156917 RepID=UPI0033F32511